jgi:hypothetical protein
VHQQQWQHPEGISKEWVVEIKMCATMHTFCLAAQLSHNTNRTTNDAWCFLCLHTTPAAVQVKADNPDFKITEIAKHIGELWAKASDKDKEKYQKKADEVGGPV